VPVLGAGLSIILAFSLDSQNWYRLLGWMGVGLIIYLGYGRRNARKVRERRAALPTSIQFYQGADMGHRGGPHHHGDADERGHKDEFTTANQGVIADSYSDPSQGVHKDNVTDAPYVPEYGHVGLSLNNDTSPEYGTSSGIATGYNTPGEDYSTPQSASRYNRDSYV